MFGECHAHIIMDGKNYKAAVSLHKVSPCENAVREHLLAWQKAGVTFVRDGGDALNVSKLAKTLAPEYGIDYRTPLFAIHKKGHYGGIVGHAFRDMQEYRSLVLQAKADGADFIKIMISGIMDFSCFGALSEEGLPPDEIQEMIDFAHSAGMRVMAHGNGDGPVRAAVEAGVDTLEHGNYLSDSTIKLLAESPVISGSYLCSDRKSPWLRKVPGQSGKEDSETADELCPPRLFSRRAPWTGKRRRSLPRPSRAGPL